MAIKVESGLDRFTIGSILVVTIIALYGCSSPPDIPKQPDAPTDGGIVNKVGNDLDKSDGRVAAAVTVARENSDKPTVVKAETGVALSYLPKPSEGDVAFARQRAAKGDPTEYKAAEEYGKKLLAKINEDWSKMEAQQKEAARVSALKDSKIKELEVKILEVESEARKNLYTLAAIGLMVIGGLAMAFGRYMAGAGLLATGLFIGAVPFLFGTVWFIPSVGGMVIVGVIVAYVHFFRKPNVAPCPNTIE
jgi:hypothetical protein